ncbi:pentatricopeptide repeat-containing protein At2g13600-like [Primulina eburnea]|uniref:pentatricopeptide repeat-containing protein At2g13600-like n=1 Tax=Primulina eburnea TaxID=1245227 RepID=UPI003C6C95EF
MPKLSFLFFTNLRKSLKMAVGSSPIYVTWKHQHLKGNLDSRSVDADVVATNKCIKFLSDKGDLEHSRHMFDEMLERTVVSWNTMITGYFRWNKFSEALDLISVMHHSIVKLDETTYSMSLSLCARAQLLVVGKQIHGMLLKSALERFKFVGSALLYMYGNCYEIGDGRRVFGELHEENELLWSLMLVCYVQCNLLSEAVDFFERMPKRGVVEWSKLISGFVNSEAGCEKALKLFKKMNERNEAVPNEFTLDCAVRACGRLADLRVGRVVHGLTIKLGFEFERSILSSLIYFYSSCELMDDAMRVYDGIMFPCLDDSNELLGGLVKWGQIKNAESVFTKMIEKNPVSYNLMIKGYAMCGRFGDSEMLFMQMPLKNLASLNTMITVYARNGHIDKAVDLFEKTKIDGGSITWNSMIKGYIHNDQHENALKLYVSMLRSSIIQTRSTFCALFQACACLGFLQQGQVLHAHLEKTPFSSNVYVGTSLIDMYSRCGSLADARASFGCISSPNVAAWTALINGHAHHGLGTDALSFFSAMLEMGINPNAATFVAVLSACTRSGLLNKGIHLFHSMKEHYGIIPTIEHFSCVVDLLGRSGLLLQAEELMESMPIEADKILLISLLNSCCFWMDMEVGERVAEKMFALDPNPSSVCVIMSNIYSGLGKWGEKLMMRKLLAELGVKKDPGCSWIDVNNRVHVFSVDDRDRPDSNMIACLESLTRNAYSTSILHFLSPHLIL